MGQVVIADSRQQRGKHNNINQWMVDHGIQVVTMKLDAGDYSTPGSNIVVDTKKDVQEVAGNIGRDHARFTRECDRARSAGLRLVVLIEEHREYNDRSKLFRWKSFACRKCKRCDPLRDKGCTRYRTKPMNGPTVAKIISGIERDHGCRFEFCRRGDTAQRICEILGIEYE